MREWDRIPVTLPGHIRAWGTKLDSANQVHQFAFLEIAILLAIGLVRMAGHLARVKPADHSLAVTSYVLGGGRRFDLLKDMIRRLDEIEQPPHVAADAQTRVVTDLVPHMPMLLDVSSRLAKRAGSARFVPRYLQAFQLSRLSQGSLTGYGDFLQVPPDPLVTKLALDVVRYLIESGHCSSDFMGMFDGL